MSGRQVAPVVTAGFHGFPQLVQVPGILPSPSPQVCRFRSLWLRTGATALCYRSRWPYPLFGDWLLQNSLTLILPRFAKNKLVIRYHKTEDRKHSKHTCKEGKEKVKKQSLNFTKSKLTNRDCKMNILSFIDSIMCAINTIVVKLCFHHFFKILLPFYRVKAYDSDMTRKISSGF